MILIYKNIYNRFIYIMEYYSAIKKEWNHTICDRKDGPGVYYANWSKSNRERPIPYYFSYMWTLKSKINKHKIGTDTENRLMAAREEGGWWAGKRVKGLRTINW